ncbi:MAG: hypothetical protein H6750_17455 [Nitrospiraceae bacterium]|nr:hypothetical protein [Nitrospiraceae bacterium]
MRPGIPGEKKVIESFNGSVLDNCFYANAFRSAHDARKK